MRCVAKHLHTGLEALYRMELEEFIKQFEGLARDLKEGQS